ncbi:MAG: phosphoheptose isomerase [Dissulfurimicrobium sp.]|uniref:phosphoheptose isomerase n=1 Tax=Dissulfurimicrobium TaxID=1769732 RepID=UPI001EDC87E9|nr:phosphoheptose isomerase [Dissulfurimicrobium hydrothermale]UKL13024.1 phosphoheptose isomerase [Dissulfurimicrobium hydrothermale]
MFYRPSYINEEEKNAILKRLWEKDPSLWSKDETAQILIKKRLGWLDVLPDMKQARTEIIDFVKMLHDMDIKRVVVLGMGGSSLVSIVLRDVFGPAEGYPILDVLDTTDPDEIRKIADKNKPGKVFFLVASKSGTTLEPNALFNYFWSMLEADLPNTGRYFAAITDPGTPLESLAAEKGFLKIFLNRSDIGGRYSALSYFGLVPAAILGLDLDKIFNQAEKMINDCGRSVPWIKNPACMLGEFLAEYALQNRDKLTIFADPKIRPMALWLEQLIAESTGKETRGIVPIIGETTGIPGFYGGERSFIYIRLKETPDKERLDEFFSEIKKAQFPVYELSLNNVYEVWGHFFLWEMAVAIASHFLDVNAFDEPDVKSTKEKARAVLDRYKAEGKMPVSFWIDQQSQFNFRLSNMLASSMKGLSRALRDIFQVLPSWGYLAFLPYLPYDKDVEEIIGEMRHIARQERSCATTLGFGPRYLHSTGQIHKGGPMSAAFLIFTRKRAGDYPVIPGLDVSFWHVELAQAVGDFEALSEARRRAIHIHLPSDYILGLKSFSKLFSRAARL